jgi:hypothetical protein
MNVTVLVFSVVLFFLLSPGILVTLPKNGSKMTIAAVHALVFGLVFYFSNEFVGQLSEGFREGKRVANSEEASQAKKYMLG